MILFFFKEENDKKIRIKYIKNLVNNNPKFNPPPISLSSWELLKVRMVNGPSNQIIPIF